MTPAEFIAKYNGQSVDYDGVYGAQCFDLFQFYNRDVVQAPFVSGQYAYQIWSNFPVAFYLAVANTPTNAPSLGDVVIWGANFNGGAGHVGIATGNCIDAILEVLEQNDPTGSPSHIKTYNYDNVIGWIHPRVLPNTVNQEVPATVEQIQATLATQIQAVSTCQTQLRSATDQITTLQGQLQTESEKVTDLTKKLNDLQSSYETEQNRNIALNKANAEISSENQDKGSELLDTQHLVAETKNYLYAIVDKLGIKRLNISDTDVTEKSLADIDGMDNVIKAQDAKITELQQTPAKATGIIITKGKSALQKFINLFVTTS